LINTSIRPPPSVRASPLLANIALSVLDYHFEARWKAHVNYVVRVKWSIDGQALRGRGDFGGAQRQPGRASGLLRYAIALCEPASGEFFSSRARLSPQATTWIAADDLA
jgi:hypothetical protein